MNEIMNFLDKEKRLKIFPAKRKIKNYALEYLISKFELNKKYNENEVNLILLSWHTFNDVATLRREMYNYHLFDRSSDGKIYIVANLKITTL